MPPRTLPRLLLGSRPHRRWDVREAGPRVRGLLSGLALLLGLQGGRAFAAEPGSSTSPPAPNLPSAPALPGVAPSPAPSDLSGPALSAPRPALPAGEAELARGLPIVELQFTGNRRVATEDASSYVEGVRVGKKFTPEALARDVQRLWLSAWFDDISVDLSRRDDGVRLRIVLREKPSVKAVEFSGNSVLDATALGEVVEAEVKAGAIVSFPAISRAIQKVRDKYAEEGHFLAEVEQELLPQRDNQVLVRLKINEREPVTVRRITFIGNEHIPEAELREVMLTGQSGFFDFGSGGTFRQDAFDRDILVLNALYYDRGYLSVQIATPRVMLTPDRTGIDLTVTVQEGPRYRIRQLRVFEKDDAGNEVEPLGGRKHLRELVRAEPGQFFNRAQLAKDLAAVQTMYRDAGYANVEAPPGTDLDAEHALVDVVVPIRRHKKVRYGRIEVRGNSKTRDKVIRRELFIHEGDLSSETLLEQSKRRVTALGYFERVDVNTSPGDDPEHVDVTIEVTEKPTGTFQLGAGFSSIENFIATAQVQQANLFGNGQSLALQAQISGLRQLVDLRVYEPYLLDSRFSLAVNAYDQLRVYSQFSQTSLGGSLTGGYPIIFPYLRGTLAYTLEHNTISTQTTSTFFGTASTVSVFRRLPLANLFNDGYTSSVRPGFTYDTRNNALFPTAGVFLQGSVELASSTFGSDNEFLRYRGTGRYYYPLGQGMVLKLNTEAGLVTSPTSAGVPIFARFFLGGILDVRGFPLRSLGPRLPLRDSLDDNASAIPNGANIGGNLMYYQNLEFEFPLLDKVGIRGVVFTDLGNAWNVESLYCKSASASPHASTNPCFSAADLLAVRTSWGFGLRWFSPLGPLRFEWGFPFQPLPYESASDFQFTIGNFF